MVLYVCALLLFLCMVSAECVCNVGSLPYRITYHSFRPMRVTLSAVKTITTTTTNVNPIQWRLYLYSFFFVFCFKFSFWFSVRHLICSFLVKFFMPIFLWFLFHSIHFVHLLYSIFVIHTLHSIRLLLTMPNQQR